MSTNSEASVGPLQSEVSGCSRFRVIQLSLVVILAFAVMTSILCFGNPQWGRFVYIFQTHIWPGEEPSLPENFSGTWTTWYSNGRKKSQIEYTNGLRHGKELYWYENGSKQREACYDSDNANGRWLEWYPDGRMLSERTYVNNLLQGKAVRYNAKALGGRTETAYTLDRKHGTEVVFDDDDAILAIRYYFNGTQVTRTEYLAACAKDPTLPKPPEEPEKPPPDSQKQE